MVFISPPFGVVSEDIKGSNFSCVPLCGWDDPNPPPPNITPVFVLVLLVFPNKPPPVFDPRPLFLFVLEPNALLFAVLPNRPPEFEVFVFEPNKPPPVFDC